MERRTVLARTAAVAAGLLAGCRAPTRSGGRAGATRRTADRTTTPRGAVAGSDLPVSRVDLVRGAPRDAIPAITDPAFASDWRGVDAEPLQNDDEVVGVERDGRARAYPLRVLAWHEVVNDDFDGPVLVSYCPLCGSALAARRTVDGEATTFGVSGLLWNADLVMYDALTGSLWSQIAATAIRGPETGERLSLVPATFTTWGTWHDDHPGTDVLLPPPRSATIADDDVARNYDVNPYGDYENSRTVGPNAVPETETDLHPKTRVLGVASAGQATAYPLPRVRAAGVVNDVVGDLPVVVAAAADGTTLVAYVRRVDGETVRFERASSTHLRAAGSRWRITTGRAVDGPAAGTVLEPATDTPAMFWFAWLDFHPETTVYG